MWTVLGDFAYRLIHVCCLMQSRICILIGVQGSSDALFCDLPISWSHVSSFNHSFSSFHPNSTQSWSKPGFSLESQAGSGCCVVVPVHPSHLLQLARRTFRWCWSWLFMNEIFLNMYIQIPSHQRHRKLTLLNAFLIACMHLRSRLEAPARQLTRIVYRKIWREAEGALGRSGLDIAFLLVQ